MDEWNQKNPDQEVHPGDRFAEALGGGGAGRSQNSTSAIQEALLRHCWNSSWRLVRDEGIDPYSCPHIVPLINFNRPYTSFPHSLPSTMEACWQVNGSSQHLAVECRKMQPLRITVYRAAQALGFWQNSLRADTGPERPHRGLKKYRRVQSSPV